MLAGQITMQIPANISPNIIFLHKAVISVNPDKGSVIRGPSGAYPLYVLSVLCTPTHKGKYKLNLLIRKKYFSSKVILEKCVQLH